MNYAQIEDGVVTRIVVTADYRLEEVAPNLVDPVECPAGVSLGWLYDGEAFSAPPPPPVDLHAYLAELRWQREVAGVTVMIDGEPVLVSTARGDDRAALHMTYSAIKNGLRADGAVFSFADGWPRRVSNTDMEAAILTALAHVQDAFDRCESVFAAIESGTIASQVEVEAAFQEQS